MRRTILAGAMLLAVPALAVNAGAAEIKLPKNMSWTAYGTTSSGYAHS